MWEENCKECQSSELYARGICYECMLENHKHTALKIEGECDSDTFDKDNVCVKCGENK